VVAGVATSYDLLPYSSKPYALTHPDNLATIAGLAGLRPPSLERCRVMELGCGAGGNLIPMAMSLPDATFVGIDLSHRQIADARSLAGALQLTNVEFRTLDIVDVDESFGLFDFVICHGVFSWVPRNVQEAILGVCRRNLGDNGVALVSYNAYPGWHLKGLVREMLRQRVRASDEPQEQVRQARSILERTGRRLMNRRDTYGRLLSDRVALAAAGSDTYLFHEYLEDVNQAMYLREFVERAAAYGLRYLGDAKLKGAYSNTERVEHEQHVDLLVDRSFRRSLLCHADIRLDPAVGAASMLECHARARAWPVSNAPDVASEQLEGFRTQAGKVWSTSNRLDKALLAVLADAHPAALSFTRLVSRVGSLVGADPSPDELAVSLRRCWAAELVDLHIRPPKLPGQIAERPTASRLARIQARTGTEVTNLRHHTVQLDSVARAMLSFLDGAHDRTALAAELSVLARTEPFADDHDGRRTGSDRWREDIDGSLERMVRFFQRSALLVS
jgi:SAM-dependent methyltransferase